MKKTSIIVPVYNTSEYLQDCFNSIFNQTQEDIEVIAINDGSTDNSLNILEQIQKEHPGLIIFSQENKGLGAARNKGMELASGEFIYFIDSDDCLVETAMEICYQCAIKYKLDVVMFDAQIFGEMSGNRKAAYDRRAVITDKEMVISGKKFADKYWLNAYCPTAWAHYFSAIFLKKYNLRFLEGMYYEDDEFHYKMLPLAERVMYIPQLLYRRRFREGSITLSKFDSRHAKDYLKMIQAINKQNHDISVRYVIQEGEYRHLHELFILCQKNNLLSDTCFAEEFYKTALAIYGNDVDMIEKHSNIAILYQLSCILKNGYISDDIHERVLNRKKDILDRICKEILLLKEDSYVGIYGCGNYAKQFMDEYIELYGNVKNKIIFIESNAETGKKEFMGFDVFNVNDIINVPLDCIIIASSRFEREIYKTIRRKYGDRFRMVCLKSDLHFGI